MFNAFRTRIECDITSRDFADKYAQACDPYHGRGFKRQMQILMRNARRQGVVTLYHS